MTCSEANFVILFVNYIISTILTISDSYMKKATLSSENVAQSYTVIQ